MILTRDVIRREIEAGRVVIDPFFADQVGPASIDLHLGDEIRVMHTGREPLPVTDEVDYRTISEVRSLQTPYPLSPGETIHGITRERITLPGDIGGWLEGRSRFARLGLMIHVTSGFVQPGVASRQALAMSNVSAMLRPAGFFVSNYAVAPSAPMEPAASLVTKVEHTLQHAGDTLFWYRKQ